jgi:glycosyltransferase involved in cell wall biosynthesis
MKIGIIAPYDVLTLNNGASVRVYELAKNLNAEGASVCVLHHGQTKFFRSTFKFVHFRAFNPLRGSSNYLHPLNITFYFALRRFLKEFQPDLIQCEQPWSAFSAVFFARYFRVPCILDEHNVEFIWARLASRLSILAPVTFVLERIASHCSSYILSTSIVDKKILMQTYKLPKEKIFVVPNGVDPQLFSRSLGNQYELKEKLGLPSKGQIIMFHGVMSAKQNYEAASLILDFIAPKLPQVSFIIIGAGSPLWLRNKAEMQTNVLVLGYVPNIEDYIIASDLCIVPIRRGSGTRLKIMEYLAAGKPVVSTIIGAEGIPIKSGVHAILCEDVNLDFIEAIKNILNTPLKAQELSNESKNFAKKMSWENITRALYDAYTQKFLERSVK